MEKSELMAVNTIDWFLDGPITDADVAKKWASLQSSAQARGKEFTVTLKKVKQLLKTKRCAYTGISFTPEQNKPNSKTIDRVDNNVGYTDENVVACAFQINALKGKMTIAEINAIHKGVTKHIVKLKKSNAKIARKRLKAA